ncbi:MAG: hypothetical protein ACLGI6_08395 [Gammaproteobacteria bacterium]
MSSEPDSTIPQQRRANAHLSRVVDIGLSYKASLGYPRAKAYMCEQGVPVEIMRRVLSPGGRCRGSGDGETF